MTIASEQFPDCCAFIIINHLGGGHPNANPENCISKTALNTYLVAKEREFYGLRSGLLCALSEPQEDRIGSVFRTRKWKCILEGTMNPRSGRKMYLYFRDLNPTEARKKRIFG